MSIYHEYQSHKAQVVLDKQKRELEVKRKQYNQIQQRVTDISPSVDMRSAYEKVINSGHVPTDKEINYRQFTSNQMNIKRR